MINVSKSQHPPSYSSNVVSFSAAKKYDYAAYRDYHAGLINEAMNSLDIEVFGKAVEIIAKARKAKGHKIYTAGNGGSAAIADHTAHNLTWDCTRDFPDCRQISAISLSAFSNELTARANDTSGKLIFSTLLGDFGRKHDVFIAITGSGESENIICALKKAKQLGLKTIVIAKEGSTAIKMADAGIGITSSDQQVLEDVSQAIMHMLVRSLSVKLLNGKQADLYQDIAHRTKKEDRTQKYLNELG